MDRIKECCALSHHEMDKSYNPEEPIIIPGEEHNTMTSEEKADEDVRKMYSDL